MTKPRLYENSIDFDIIKVKIINSGLILVWSFI